MVVVFGVTCLVAAAISWVVLRLAVGENASTFKAVRYTDKSLDDRGMDEERPPICPACGVTMVPAALSALECPDDWVCLECEETDEQDA